MTEISDLTNEFRALQEIIAAGRAPPPTIVTRAEYEATEPHERAALIRGKTLIDGLPPAPTPRPEGAMTREKYDALPPRERAGAVRGRTLVD